MTATIIPVGAQVRVVGPKKRDRLGFGERVVDVSRLKDCFDPRHIGNIGVVADSTANGRDFDIGDSPEDPAYLVVFPPDMDIPAKQDAFWGEELEVLVPGADIGHICKNCSTQDRELEYKCVDEHDVLCERCHEQYLYYLEDNAEVIRNQEAMEQQRGEW